MGSPQAYSQRDGDGDGDGDGISICPTIGGSFTSVM